MLFLKSDTSKLERVVLGREGGTSRVARKKLCCAYDVVGLVVRSSSTLELRVVSSFQFETLHSNFILADQWITCMAILQRMHHRISFPNEPGSVSSLRS